MPAHVQFVRSFLCFSVLLFHWRGAIIILAILLALSNFQRLDRYKCFARTFFFKLYFSRNKFLKICVCDLQCTAAKDGWELGSLADSEQEHAGTWAPFLSGS